MVIVILKPICHGKSFVENVLNKDLIIVLCVAKKNDLRSTPRILFEVVLCTQNTEQHAFFFFISLYSSIISFFIVLYISNGIYEISLILFYCCYGCYCSFCCSYSCSYSCSSSLSISFLLFYYSGLSFEIVMIF